MMLVGVGVDDVEVAREEIGDVERVAVGADRDCGSRHVEGLADGAGGGVDDGEFVVLVVGVVLRFR